MHLYDIEHTNESQLHQNIVMFNVSMSNSKDVESTIINVKTSNSLRQNLNKNTAIFHNNLYRVERSFNVVVLVLQDVVNKDQEERIRPSSGIFIFFFLMSLNFIQYCTVFQGFKNSLFYKVLLDHEITIYTSKRNQNQTDQFF